MDLKHKLEVIPRRGRVDLRKLPMGAGYVIAGVVSALVIFAAWYVSREGKTPDWWGNLVIPAIYWSSPFLVALAIYSFIRRRRMAGKRVATIANAKNITKD